MYDSARIYLAAGSVTGLSVAVYLVYRYITASDSRNSRSAEVKTSRPARIEVKVPRKCVGSVIGRGGCSIRAIEKETGTRIIVKKELETEDFRTFEIRGAPENAQLAETAFLKIIEAESEIESEEILVPHSVCGTIIGKNGQRIRIITKDTKARIKVYSEEMNKQGQHKVTITGTRTQIENAKSMIYEIMSQATNVSNKSSDSEASSNYSTYICAVLGLHEGFLEMFVSAMESPSRFWIQVLGKKSLELDNLVQKMTRYYAEPSNSVQHKLKEVLVGQLVASSYGKDEKWYRAKVMEVSENQDEVTLFYLDYGDTATVASSNVLALDIQFLKLHFQAIECRLANVIPNSGEWTEAAKEFFRNLCQVAQWKALEAKIMNLADLKLEQSEKIVLAVELYDRENGWNIRVTEEMVRKGFAKFRKPI